MEDEGEEDEAHFVVQWFGNSHGQVHGYNAKSKFDPGWEDLGDFKQPLVFSVKEPKKGGRFHITGPVVPYETTVPISTFVQHGFVLSSGLLPRGVQKVLADLHLGVPSPASESPTSPDQAQARKSTTCRECVSPFTCWSS